MLVKDFWPYMNTRLPGTPGNASLKMPKSREVGICNVLGVTPDRITAAWNHLVCHGIEDRHILVVVTLEHILRDRPSTIRLQSMRLESIEISTSAPADHSKNDNTAYLASDHICQIHRMTSHHARSVGDSSALLIIKGRHPFVNFSRRIHNLSRLGGRVKKTGADSPLIIPQGRSGAVCPLGHAAVGRLDSINAVLFQDCGIHPQGR